MTDVHHATVLIVEDNRIMADVLRRALEHGRFNVQVAFTGLQAMECCGKSDFDAIVSDYQMPEMDGLEFVKSLRSGTRNQSVPVIFVSGKGLELDSEMLRRDFDVRQVMFKPFSPRELVESLNDLVTENVALAMTQP